MGEDRSTTARMVNLLAEAIKTSGCTQGRFARQVGLSENYISKIVHGRRRVTMDTLDEWAAILGFRWNVSLTPRPTVTDTDLYRDGVEPGEQLARDLCALWRAAGRPTIRVLSGRTEGRAGHTAVSRALAGEKVSWMTVRALADVLDGDEDALYQLWLADRRCQAYARAKGEQ